MNRPAGLVHSLVLLQLFLLTAPAQAQFTFTTNNGAITITGYVGGGLVVIPAATNGLPVTSIGDGAFQSGTLTGLTLGTNITSIGMKAFNNCSQLASVTIPASVTNLGPSAFGFCGGLAAINVDAGNLAYVSVAGIVYDHSQTTLVEYPAGNAATAYAIPANVSRIGSFAFDECLRLTSVTVGTNVTSIGSKAFTYCQNLTNVTLLKGVTSVGTNAFNYCNQLTNITIPGSVTNVGNYVFQGCTGLKSVFFQGNAPAGNTGVFLSAPATAYYLPGRSGWSSTFDGIPAVLWNPSIPTSGGFGRNAGNFGFTIVGTMNIPIVLQASTNLAGGEWTTLLAGTLTNGSIYFAEPADIHGASRFYRIRSP